MEVPAGDKTGIVIKFKLVFKTDGQKARDMAHCARELALAENPHGGSQLPVQPPVPSGLHGYKAYMWCTDIHVAPHICT